MNENDAHALADLLSAYVDRVNMGVGEPVEEALKGLSSDLAVELRPLLHTVNRLGALKDRSVSELMLKQRRRMLISLRKALAEALPSPSDWLDPTELNRRIGLALIGLLEAHGFLTDLAEGEIAQYEIQENARHVLNKIEAGMCALEGPDK